jgi:alpha-beta hydrolase superfamily lysophospholipase
MFHPDAARAAIPMFDPDRPWPGQGAADDYSRYYALDEERRHPGLLHAGGWIEAAGYRVLVHCFRPAVCRGTVFIVHGYLEHSGLYPQLLPRILQQGYAVVIHDLPGHGLSSGVRVGIRDFSEYQILLDRLLARVAASAPKPWLGLGQSTGGGILMEHVLQACQDGRPPAFERLFLLAPLVLPTPFQWWQIRGAFWLVGALRTVMPRNFRRNTSDDDFLHFVRHDDPLQSHWMPVGWINALRRWVPRMHRFPPADFPVWLVQGERDTTVNGRYNRRFIHRRFRVRVSLRLGEASHQLANERRDIRAPLDILLTDFLQQ